MTITFHNKKHGFNLDELAGAIKAQVAYFSSEVEKISEDKGLAITISETESSFRVTADWVSTVIEDRDGEEIRDNDYFTLLKSDSLEKFNQYMIEMLENVNKHQITYESMAEYAADRYEHSED